MRSTITWIRTRRRLLGEDGRLTLQTFLDAEANIPTYAYDDADRLTSVTDAAGNATQYAYDTENNLLSIKDALLRTTSFAYDARGRVTQTTFPSSLVESYTSRPF